MYIGLWMFIKLITADDSARLFLCKNKKKNKNLKFNYPENIFIRHMNKSGQEAAVKRIRDRCWWFLQKAMSERDKEIRKISSN